MRFLFYFWFFAEIADIYFVWFYELLETRDLLILPAGFLTSVDMPWCEGSDLLETIVYVQDVSRYDTNRI